MRNFIPVEKRSKKAQREYFKSKRGVCGMNTGERPMKTMKLPTRAMQKVVDRRIICGLD